ncbi:MAG TPA: M55 family metallopeptidase [Candidatus Wallbacteria bacterium]|nr:M55 family metallopeptidase [Candidatus Wallbacteria bacterium]
MVEKYYISCDMEGITGITNFKEMEEQKAYASKMMTSEIREVANSINGARAASGVEKENIEIIVADSHSLGVNIIHSELPSNVKLIRGFPRRYYMAPYLDASYSAIMFVGYHARIGSFEAGMDHTFSGSSIYGIQINGCEVGEFEINAGLAGHYEIPVAFASGDDKFIKQIDGFKKKMGFETVVTKEALSRYSAVLYHPDRVYKDFRSAITKTLEERNWAGKPLKYDYPLDIKIELTNTVKADLVSLIPVLTREDGRTIRFKAPDFLYFYNMLCAILPICWTDR